MKTVAFLLPNLRGGGAERVFVHLMNALDRTRFNPLLILIEKKGDYLGDIAPDVTVIDLASRRFLHSLPRLWGTLHRIRPDFLLVSHGYISLTLALLSPFLLPNTRIVVREANLPSRWITTLPFWRRLFFSFLYRFFFRRIRYIVAQSTAMRHDISTFCHIPPERITTIPNPIDMAAIEQYTRSPSPIRLPEGKKRLLAVGRLVPQKQYPLLLEAVRHLLPDIPFYLVICGEGPEKRLIEETINRMGISPYVHLAGFMRNPYPLMKEVDLLILSSAFEGFPNVLIESHACGTPTVSFDKIGGVEEIIVEGVNGFFACYGDPLSLAYAIRRALSFSWSRERIRATAVERFAISHIIRSWETLFSE